jgi:hypothetical protein
MYASRGAQSTEFYLPEARFSHNPKFRNKKKSPKSLQEKSMFCTSLK